MGEKLVIFGAGDGGFQVTLSLTDKFEIIAYADNDPQKQGKTMFSKPVIKPEQITFLDYDYVVIANLHGQQVKKQLLKDCNVNEEQIIDYYHSHMFDSRITVLRHVAEEINIRNIAGAIAELGVFKGEFAKYISNSFSDRQFYLFDTFNGFDERDITKEREGGFSNSKKGEFMNTNIQLVLDKIKNPSRCVVKKGYFPETTDGLETEQFAFVSLDVDLYEPILAGLEYFYPRLSPGGYIFVHDYNSTRFSGVKQAVKEFSKKHPIKLVPLSDISGTVVIVK
ncbi:TylF/MycF/NovP-related O-methyltransferase [Paenibacillus pabuli]|uniref:TylF/MycF/NovP-related O-methyltransferase n=1 Tax=Paenibacillus pabuli TaxID=1472 RepID=UPI000785FEF6|nr:TylF/MycF/NovP-related O-methyltransferase [Paenibacillus pabuli]MEC0129070.1 TylF/MycF/NovP-related O-methyltransferase [Paenibacillus pabuli]